MDPNVSPQTLEGITPAQAQQLQHIQRFAHILVLPMFPLYTGADAIKRQNLDNERRRRIAEYAQIKAESDARVQQQNAQLTTADKVGLQILGAATGTTLFSSGSAMDKATSGMASFGMMMDVMDSNQKADNLLIIVRWTTSPESTLPPVIIDVLEIRGVGQESSGAYCHVRPNRDVKIRLGPKKEKKIKEGDRWSKTIYGGDCGVTLIEKGKGEEKLEMVQSMQLPVTVSDMVNVLKRYKKEWAVPSL
ncbi:hypothetical protein FB567DRAFT_552951 [Paraphoma chrysanthemicola]|uniref:Uncharacterized protein n=1 Tax=Paraphoma chrysanthemicola TaxID=798071 RepID=A0A8K0QYZ2_9PLEO|nr:hypothetical protein FB567DRAFT_552951 [Paraphoma chrysanthemicola]